MTDDPTRQRARLARRPLIHTAWAAPVVVMATTSPALAVSGITSPSITLTLRNYDANSILFTVRTSPPPQAPATSNYYDLEGYDAGSDTWVLVYQYLTTDSTGSARGTYPHAVLDAYAKARARMQVFGGYVYSAEVPVPLN